MILIYPLLIHGQIIAQMNNDEYATYHYVPSILLQSIVTVTYHLN